MSRVLDHIDAHLDEDLDIATLAAVAHFSSVHFHRVFAAWLGEALGDYLRRRRLEVAAVRLAGQRQTPILHIALSVGFSSGDAFAHAFKHHFGSTPSVWRAQTPARWGEELARVRHPDQVERKRDQAPKQLAGDDDGFPDTAPPMDVTLTTLPPTRIAYLRHIGPYGPSVSRFWQEQFLPWRRAHQLEHGACYGIGHDAPYIGDPLRCRYDAGVEVPDTFIARGQAGIATLPGGRYAMAAYRGDGPGIARAWTELLRNWLPASGLQIDGRPCFEFYPADTDYDPATGTFACALCLPVRPL